MSKSELPDHFSTVIRKINLLYEKQQYFLATECGLNALRHPPSVINPEEEDFENQLFKFLVYEKLATIYLDLNNPTQAITYLIKMIKIEQIEPNPNWQRLGGIYAKLGKSCFYLCNYDESAYFLNLAKEILEKNNCQETNEMGLALLQLGNYYRFMFQDEDAEKSIKQSIEIRQNLFGDQSHEVAESLHGLSQLYTDMGQIEQAEIIINSALEILARTLGQKHIKTAKSLYLKGNLYLRHHKPDLQKAEQLIHQSLQINKEIVGEHFLETADCYHSLGKIKAQDNKSSNEFQIYFEKALSILEDIYGKTHACIAILLNNLGRSYFDRKQFEEASQCFTRSISIYKLICGRAHGNLAITLKSSADCHKNLGRMKEAHTQYLQSLAIYKSIESNYSYTINQIQKLLKETETED